MALIAVDLDGTLLNSSGRLSEGNAEALRNAAERGHLVVPATARWYQAACQPFNRIGLTVPAVAAAGADVRLADGGTIVEAALPTAFTRFVAELCDGPGRVATLTTPSWAYRRADELPPWAANAPEWLRPVTHLRDADLSRLLCVLAEFPSGDTAPRELDRWAGQITLHHAVSFRGDVMLTMTAAGVDKGTGLEALRSALAFERRDVVAIGDSEVDLPMFPVAGRSVAMANAEPAVKERATLVTASADDDGVARAFEELGLLG